MTNRSSCRGNLILVFGAVAGMLGHQPGFARSQDIEQLSKAAGQGDAQAQNNLGVMYDKGMGIPQDNRKAVQWY